jgi:hypothetical protein
MKFERLRNLAAMAAVTFSAAHSSPVDIKTLSQNPCIDVGKSITTIGYMRGETQPHLLDPITGSAVAIYISGFDLYPNSQPLKPDSSANYNPGSNGDIYGKKVNPHIAVSDIHTVKPSVSMAPQARPDGWVRVTGQIEGNTYGCVIDTNNQVTPVPHR